MQNDQSQISVVAAANSELLELQTFEQGLVKFIGSRGLPTEKVLVSVSERMRVFDNVEHVLNKLDHGRREKSVYISKLLAAAASGLFDAALNYLWDETIFELRSRVAQYGVCLANGHDLES